MSDYKVKPLFSSSPAPVSQPTPEPAAAVVNRARPLFAASSPAKAASVGPVKAGPLDLPGVFIRRRLPIDRDALRLEYQIEEQVLDQAVEVITRINVDQIQVDSFTDFGLEEQQAGSDFSGELFQLTTDPRIEKNLSYIQKIADLMGVEENSFLSLFSSGQKTDRSGEINSKAVFLRGELKTYPELLRRAETLQIRCQKVLTTATAWCVAGQYVSKYLKTENDKTRELIADTIDRRVQSFLTTQIALRHNQLQLNQFIQNIRYQYTNVLDVLENMVPIWISSIQKNQSNPTLKKQILQVLKGSYA